MNLCIDIGNTRTKLSIFDENRLIKQFTPGEDSWENYPVSKAILSITGKKDVHLLNRLDEKNIPYIILSSKLDLPFKVRYASPDSLGPDRIALVAGALQQAEGNLLIIDAGTCITYDFVNERREYLGGGISPGLRIRYQALHNYTSKLPLLQPPGETPELTGNDTVSSIHSGVFLGTIKEIEGMAGEYRSRFPDVKIILTGGDAPRLANSLKISIFAHIKFLQAYGLNDILNRNLQ